ncbi:MAG: hypothetical protein ABIJ56_23760 [Pseudomonadota bacterium]
MADFTKWEQNSLKANILFPVAFIAIGLVLVVVMLVVKPKTVVVQKADAKTTEEVEESSQGENIDWENF